MIPFDAEAFAAFSKQLFTTDSPTGYTGDVIRLLDDLIRGMGYTPILHNKGTLEVRLDGRDPAKTVATSAHVDTLGLMVRSVKGDGKLALTKIGGAPDPDAGRRILPGRHPRGNTLFRHHPVHLPRRPCVPGRRYQSA